MDPRALGAVLLLLTVSCGKQRKPLETAQEGTAGLVTVETGRDAPTPEEVAEANATERDEVLEVLHSSQPSAQTCYAEGVQRDPSLYGDLVARIEVSGDGTVTSVRTVLNTVRDEVVTGCVLEALQALSFPEPSKDPLVLKYPYVFVSDLTPPEVVRALYIEYGFIDPDDEVSPDDKRKKLPSGEAGWYEHW